MGKGYAFKCKTCGHEYNVNIGIGFMYPQIFRETLEKIAAGEYGAEWKEAYDKNLYVAIDAATVLFKCNKCGNWEKGKDISLYAPNHPELIPTKQYGEKTVEEWGYVPYVTYSDLVNEYHLIKPYQHKCKRCGEDMQPSNEVPECLPCPNCGSESEMLPSIIMWD